MKVGRKVQSVIAGNISLCLLAQELLMMNECLTAVSKLRNVRGYRVLLLRLTRVLLTNMQHT